MIYLLNILYNKFKIMYKSYNVERFVINNIYYLLKLMNNQNYESKF